jgi:hypothetical protein
VLALKTSREHLVEAYITPLRSAILIDDAFPRYEDLLPVDETVPETTTKYDYPGVRRLLELCRGRDLMCDVENRAMRILGGDKLSHVLKSDLVVLDYHLVPTDVADPKQALQILSKLATSPHDNLVVVYTNGNPQQALLETAVHFRGVDASAEYSAELAAELADWRPEMDIRLLYAAINGDAVTRKTLERDLRSELDVRKIPKAVQTEAIRVRTETWLLENYARMAPKLVERPRLEMSAAESGAFWLSCENVFVTFVKKSPDADIFKSLEDALVAWSPSILRLMLARARTELEQGGFEYDRSVVWSDALKIGLLYHALAGEEPDERLRIRSLFSRLFEGLHDQLAATVSDFGYRLLRAELGDGESGVVKTADKQLERLEAASSLARSSSKQPLEAVLLELNAFLCSAPFAGSHVTTGTVFRDVSSQECWLCVSPACELVPRKPLQSTWQHELHPCLPMFALRLKSAGAHGALTEAHDGRSIFIRDGQEISVLHVVDANTKLPVPVMFMASNEGRTDEGIFAAHAVMVTAEDTVATPQFTLKRFVAVAQLRHEYADRLLQLTGQHTSRIGVDFVRLLPN